jgi:hypothetical protein
MCLTIVAKQTIHLPRKVRGKGGIAVLISGHNLTPMEIGVVIFSLIVSVSSFSRITFRLMGGALFAASFSKRLLGYAGAKLLRLIA